MASISVPSASESQRLPSPLATLQEPNSPATLAPSLEANVSSRPICPGAEYNPSGEASPENRQVCPIVIYNPSGSGAPEPPLLPPSVSG